jgi:hypothetical protein
MGLGMSAPRFGGNGPCIVKVVQHFSFAFLDKWIYFQICFFLITSFFMLLLLKGGGVIVVIAYSSLTPEERRHTMKLGVSIGVPR